MDRLVDVVDTFYGVRGYKHGAFGQPTAGFHNEVADAPLLVIEVHVLDAPQFIVRGLYCIAFQAAGLA
jgi:hypothetical protein